MPQSKYDPTKRRQPPLALSAVPDRSLSTLGAYAKLKKGYTHKTTRIPMGTVGIVVRDTRSECKTGEIAVKIPGWKIDYFNIPLKVLEVERAKR